MQKTIKTVVKLADPAKPISSYKPGEVISSFEMEVSNYREPLTPQEIKSFLSRLKAK